MTGRSWTLCLAALVTALLAYSTQFAALSAPNERSRVYLAVAAVDHHTLAIDQPLRRFGHILDTARHGGRHYSDKAPGSSLPAAMLYGVVRVFTPATAWSIEDLLLLVRRGIMIPAGVIAFLLLRGQLRHAGVAPPLRDLASLGTALGTGAFHYSTVYYGHQLVALALLAALALVHAAEARGDGTAPDKPSWRAAGLAGLAGGAAGYAGFTEYQAGLLCVLLAGYVLLGPLRGRPLALAAFALGAVPWVVALGAYNTAAFGGPLQLSYHHLSSAGLQSIHEQGVGGITTPSWNAFGGAFGSLHRGLFTTSPWLALAPLGVITLWRAGRRRLATLVLLALGAFGLFVSSSNMWVAGWGFGPRLLVPVLPWLALAAAHGAQVLGRWAVGEALVRAALLVSVLYHQVMHAFFPESPDNAANPLLDVVAPLWRAGLVSPNLGRDAGLSTAASLVPLGLLVALAVGVLLLRRLRWRAWWARLLAQPAHLIGVAVLLVAVQLVGPTRSDEARREFVELVAGMARDER